MTIVKNVKKVFANEKQQKFLRSRAKRKSLIGGRGFGKTDTLGKTVGMAFDRMARAKFILAGLTYVQIDLVTLPVIKESLEYMGIFEYNPKKNPYGHYVIGVKPPAHWATPYKAIGRLGYQYCMSFINGFTLQFASQDRPETHRGLNSDGLLNDESALMSHDFIYKVLKKTVRGNIYKHFSKDPLFHCHYDFSSAAWTQEGMHIYKTEDLWKEEYEKRKGWSQQQLKDVPPEFLFMEATCLDNPILGQEYYNRQKAESDPLEFSVEVDNERLTQLPNGFYFTYSAQRHAYFQQYAYQDDDKTGIVTWDTNDYKKDKPLEVSLDFNADICWSLVCQEVGRQFRVINSNYVKPTLTVKTSIVTQNADWFCKQYANHEKKDVYIYGDPGGNSRSAGSSESNKTFYDQYCQVLRSNGWTIYRRELTSYPRHKDKYQLINLLLGETSERTPRIRINQQQGHNATFLKALLRTPADQDFTKGKAKVGKDKTSEQKLTRDRELATDSTDAFDYILWAKYKHCLPNLSSAPKNNPYFYRPS